MNIKNPFANMKTTNNTPFSQDNNNTNQPPQNMPPKAHPSNIPKTKDQPPKKQNQEYQPPKPITNYTQQSQDFFTNDNLTEEDYSKIKSDFETKIKPYNSSSEYITTTSNIFPKDSKTLSGLSTLLGKILSIHPSKKGTSGGHTHKDDSPKEDNGIKYTIGDDISYSQTCISFNVKAMSKKEISKTTLFLGTMVDSNFVNCDKWEIDTGLRTPFSIKTYITNNSHNVCDCFETSLINTTKHGEPYGIKFSSKDNQKHMFFADLTITILLKRKDLRPNVKF